MKYTKARRLIIIYGGYKDVLQPDFQNKFRSIYQQLKIVDKVMDVKNIYPVEKKLYKIVIDKSRIAIRVENDTAIIGSFP